MDLLAFPNGSYIELIAPFASLSRAAGMMSRWTKLMEADAGCGAWAAQTDDIHAEVQRLRAAGIAVNGPQAGSRQRPDGTKLEWETAIVGNGPAGSVLPFFIQDSTPRELRVPVSTEGTIRGVAAVVVGVHKLESSIALFQQAFAFEDPAIEDRPEFSATLAHFPNTPVVLAAGISQDSWLSDRLAKFGECPVAFLLQVTPDLPAINSPAATKSALWFGREVAWFDPQRLHGTRLGLIR
jgi:hypothetical protein